MGVGTYRLLESLTGMPCYSPFFISIISQYIPMGAPDKVSTSASDRFLFSVAGAGGGGV